MFKTLGTIISLIIGGMSINNIAKNIDTPESPIITNAIVNTDNPKSPIVTLNYTSKIMDKNLLYVTGFEDGDMASSYIFSPFASGHHREFGGQSKSSEHTSDGKYSTKIEDTFTNSNRNKGTSVTGDHLGYGTDSRLKYNNRIYLPDNINVSVTADVLPLEAVNFKANGVGGNIDIPKQWGDKIFLKDAKKGDTKISISGLTIEMKNSLKNGAFFDIVTLYGVDGKYKISAIKDIDVENNEATLVHPMEYDAKAGDPVYQHQWIVPVNFQKIYLNASNEWQSIQMNTMVDSSLYTTSKRGIEFEWFTETRGTVYLDNIRFGYANKIKLMRNNTEIYEGYDLTFKDTEAKDIASPNTIESIQGNIVLKDSTKNLIKVNFTAPEDNGTDYIYTAIASFDDNESPISKPEKVNIKTGIDGYSYIIDNNPSTVPDNTIDTRDTVIEKEVPRDDKVYYIHLKSIDKAGNASDTLHQKIETHRTDLTVSKSSTGVELNWSFSDSNVNNYYFKIFRKEENNEFIELVSNEKNINYIDDSATDNTKPQIPSIDTSKYNESTNSFEYTIEPPIDDGTEYSYYIETYLNNGDKVSTSNIESINIKSGIKGVSYILDTNSNSTPDNNIDILDKIITPVSNNGQFLHIKAIDNNDNSSDVLHFKAFDDENPSLDLRLTDYYPTNKDISIVATGNDNMGIDYILLPNGEKVYSKTVNYTVSQDGSYTFLVCDIAGNTTTKTIDITNIDKDVDGVEITKSKNIFTKDNITIKIRVNDKSGVNYIILPNGNKVLDNNIDYEVEEDGIYNFTIRDNAGNEKVYSVTVDNIDKIFPTITVSKNNNWTNKPVKITINGRD